MSKFLSADEIYDLIERELPENVYPKGPPDRYYSTADSFATASGIADAYDNLERIYDNYFPQSADERISDWENYIFGKRLDSVLTLQERRDRVIGKMRERKSMSRWSLLTAVLEIVPVGTLVQIYPFYRDFGEGWKLGISQLGVNTKLGGRTRTVLSGGANAYCSTRVFTWQLGVSRLGSTTILGFPRAGTISNDWYFERWRAYAYDMRIFDYTLSQREREQIDERLNELEPARSDHLIRDNLDPVTYNLTSDVTDVDEFSDVRAIYKDPTSETGYSGRE